MKTHFTPATDVALARMPDSRPSYRPPALINDIQLAAKFAKGFVVRVLREREFTNDEAHSIAANIMARVLVREGVDVSMIDANALHDTHQILNGLRAFTLSHPGGEVSAAWAMLDARAKWTGKAYDAATRSA